MFAKIKSAPINRTDMLSNVFCLFGEIDDKQALEITEWILYNNYLPLEEKPEALTLVVNSGGGSLPAAFCIIDFMMSSEIPVHTIGSGMIASAGLFIVMSGSQGNRTLSENTSIMSHEFSCSGNGDGEKYHEILAIQKEFKNTQNRLLKHIEFCTGLSKKKINKQLMNKSDIWLTAQEAVKLGLADSIQKIK